MSLLPHCADAITRQNLHLVGFEPSWHVGQGDDDDDDQHEGTDPTNVVPPDMSWESLQVELGPVRSVRVCAGMYAKHGGSERLYIDNMQLNQSWRVARLEPREQSRRCIIDRAAVGRRPNSRRGCSRIPSPDFLDKLRVCGAVQATMPDDIAGFFFGTFAFVVLLCSLKVFVKYSHGRRKRQLGERLLIRALQLMRILPPDPPEPSAAVAGIAPASGGGIPTPAAPGAVPGCAPQAVSSTAQIPVGSDALFNAPSSTARQVEGPCSPGGSYQNPNMVDKWLDKGGILDKWLGL